MSAHWSDAPGRALLEFDRTLLYLAVLVLFGLFAARAGDLGTLLRWTAAAAACVCVVGAADPARSRHVPDRPAVGADTRLAFPLTYWNALGVLAAIGLVLLLHVTSSIRQPAVARVLAAAAMPAVAVTLYFTFSRGGSRGGDLRARGLPRARPLARLRCRRCSRWGPTTAFALKRAFDADLLAGAQFDQPGRGRAAQRRARTSWSLRAGGGRCCARLLLLGDHGLARIALSRRRRFVGKAVAVAVAFALAGTAVASGVPDACRSGAPRAARHEPAAGTCAATSRSGTTTTAPTTGASRSTSTGPSRCTAPAPGPSSARGSASGPDDRKVVDAHSLYLEVLSELGLAGPAVPGVALLTPLAFAVAAAARPRAPRVRRVPRRGRRAAAARGDRLGLGDAGAVPVVLRRERHGARRAGAGDRGRRRRG